MKKIFAILFAILLFTGCSCSLMDTKPEAAIDTFFEKYRNYDNNIISQLQDTLKNEDMSLEQSKKYQELMEKQYDQFAYVIKDIKEEKDAAEAEVEVTVLNYRSAILEVEEELKNTPEKFNDDNGNFSTEKYINYKIEKMSEVDDTTTHTIEIYLTKENGMWKVNQLSNDDISKLHGLY